ncbi:MAG: T9SS type A sorting domain-containing protein [Bacteroidota bacterium]
MKLAFTHLFTLVAIALATVLCINPSSAQQLEQVYPKDKNNSGDLKDLVIDPSGLGYAIGSCNTFLRTEDGGDNWDRLDFVDNSDLLDIDIFPETDGQKIIVATYGLFYISEDAGETWEASEDFSNQSGIAKVVVIDQEHFVVLLRRGVVVRVGPTGSEQIGPIANEANVWEAASIKFVDEQHGRIGLRLDSNAGLTIFQTKDGGRSWQENDKEYFGDESIVDYDFFNRDTGFILTRGTDNLLSVYRSTNQGQDWRRHFLLSQISYSFNETIIALGIDDVVFTQFRDVQRLTNWGRSARIKSFVPFTPTVPNFVLSPGGLTIDQDRNFWFYTNSNSIFKSSENNSDWQRKNGAEYPHLQEVLFPDEQSIVAFSTFPLLQKIESKDKGQSWQTESFIISGLGQVVDILPLGRDRYLVAMSQNGLNILENGQLTNVLASNTFNCILKRSPHSNTLYALIVNFPNSDIFKSTNNGQSWELLHTFQFRATDLEVPSEEVLYVSGIGGDLDKSEDGGRTWNVLLSREDLIINDISFFSPDNGFIMGNRVNLFTADGGRSFEVIDQSNNLNLIQNKRIQAVANSEAWTINYLLPSFGLSYTKDGGANWINPAPNCGRLLTIAQNPYTGELWFSTDWGGLFKLDPTFLSLKALPRKTNSMLLYPNPVEGYLTIDIILQDRTVEFFRLYGSNGNLLSQFNISNLSTTHFDTSTLPNGLYLLEAVGPNFSDVQKFIKQ